MSVFKTAKLWLIRALLRFSISGLLARRGSTLVLPDNSDEDDPFVVLLLLTERLFEDVLAVIALKHFGVDTPKYKILFSYAAIFPFCQY